MMDNFDSGINHYHGEPHTAVTIDPTPHHPPPQAMQQTVNTNEASPDAASMPVNQSASTSGARQPTQQPLESSLSTKTLDIDDDDFIVGKVDYSMDAEYDPCREWLRLLTALVSLCVGVVAVYPIHLGIDCYFDNLDNETIDLEACTNLFNIPYSLTVLGVAIAAEVVCLILFFFACRHEFFGVKRKYKTGLLCCQGGSTSRAAVTPIPRAPKYDKNQ